MKLNPVLAKFHFSSRVDQAELREIRERGYAVDYGVQTTHVARVACPIFNVDRRVVGTLGVAGPIFYNPPGSIDEAIAQTAEITTRFSAALGFVPPGGETPQHRQGAPGG